MYEAWLSFLEYCFPIHQIDRVIIYTDKKRYWLAKGLADCSQANEWKISISLLTSVSDEDATDIQNSFTFLPESTLIAGIFSNNNNSIDIINHIFPPLYSPIGFQGFSLVTLQNYPDQFFTEFLLGNYNNVLNLFEFYKDSFNAGVYLNISSLKGTEIRCKLKSNIEKFPFQVDYMSDSRHVIFPATELIAELIPQSVNGYIVIDLTIGEYFESDELIDPFGLVIEPIKLFINNGKITEIEGNDILSRRLNSVLNEMQLSEKLITKLGIGIGPKINHTGFIQVDKLIGETCNFGITNRKIEFVINNPKIEIIDD